MAESWVRLDLIQFLFEHRSQPATWLFQSFTFLGEVEGYVLVISLIFVAYDKKLAFRLSVMALVAMSLNFLLKTVIANPRPFVAEGTYAEKWAVSPAKAEALVAEFSSPSGHAMAGSAFYTYLYASVKKPCVRIAAVVALLLTGLSRPYLGVHYLEDVVMGWALGIPLALLAIRYARPIRDSWDSRSLPLRLLIVVASSLVLWLATLPFYDSNTLGQPHAFLSYTGFLAGIVVAYPLEARWVDFDPRSSTMLHKALRYAICVALVMGTLLLLDEVCELIATDASPLGNALRYVRYALAGMAGTLLGPVLFGRFGLATVSRQRYPDRSAL